MISVGAESLAAALRHARHAADCGADAVMATPPLLHAAGDDELLRYFTTIAARVDIPLIVQDASGYVGPPLPVGLQARLHGELGDRVMFKPEAPPIGPRLTRLLDATDGRARVFEGTGGLFLIDSFRRGAIGTMPASDVVWALSALWRALQDGDFPRAYRIAARWRCWYRCRPAWTVSSRSRSICSSGRAFSRQAGCGGQSPTCWTRRAATRLTASRTCSARPSATSRPRGYVFTKFPIRAIVPPRRGARCRAARRGRHGRASEPSRMRSAGYG